MRNLGGIILLIPGIVCVEAVGLVEIPLDLLPFLHDLLEIELSRDLLLALRFLLHDHCVLSVSFLHEKSVVILKIPETLCDRLLHLLRGKHRFIHASHFESMIFKYCMVRCGLYGNLRPL